MRRRGGWKPRFSGSQLSAVLYVVPHRYRAGYSFQARCLIVSHCYREPDSVIRLISARRATAQEEEVYWSLR